MLKPTVLGKKGEVVCPCDIRIHSRSKCVKMITMKTYRLQVGKTPMVTTKQIAGPFTAAVGLRRVCGRLVWWINGEAHRQGTLPARLHVATRPVLRQTPIGLRDLIGLGPGKCSRYVTKGSLSYLSSPCFSKNVLQSGVGIVH